MKLFKRTLYIFISLIVFQSGFTIILITNVIKKSNSEDLRSELENESATIYNSFNSWKRSIWSSLIDLKNDKKLKNLLTKATRVNFRETVVRHLAEKFSNVGFDSFVIKGNGLVDFYLMPLKYRYSSVGALRSIANRKNHPYIELKLLDNELLMIGAIRLYGTRSSYIDIFIVEHINNEFCSRIIVNRRSRVGFFLGDTLLCGNFNGKIVREKIELSGMNTCYKEFYNVEIGSVKYGIAAQKIDELKVNGKYRDLFLITGLSNTPYVARLFLIRRTVLYVSLISALLTIVLSFFLTKNITRPIKDLLFAMYRIKDGDYDVRIEVGQDNEIGELFKGFTEMADKLYQDKLTMERYIREITFLNDYNEKILHSIRVGIAIINGEYIIEKANDFFFEFFNLKEGEVIGKKIDSFGIVDEGIISEMGQLMGGKKDFYSTIKRYRNKRVYEIKLYPFRRGETNEEGTSRCILVADDISKKIEFEEKIFQAEKLSSIGMLSAGVAHEVNNPLSSIMTNIQNLIEDEKDESRRISLKLIEQETRRIARIVRELLEFSSTKQDRSQGADVNRVIDEVVRLISYSLKQDRISIEKDLAVDIPRMAMSEDELKQIIINLIKNSIQAITDEGQIVIKTGVRVNAKKALVFLSVRDNGIGMEKEIIPKIFDPFFTTKHNGEGTGLGLSVVYGIINKYKGSIKIKSKPGEGTEVILEVPALMENFETRESSGEDETVRSSK